MFCSVLLHLATLRVGLEANFDGDLQQASEVQLRSILGPLCDEAFKGACSSSTKESQVEAKKVRLKCNFHLNCHGEIRVVQRGKVVKSAWDNTRVEIVLHIVLNGNL